MTDGVERDRRPAVSTASDGADARVTTGTSSDRLSQLEAELAAYKRAKRLADLEIVELRAHLREAEQLRQSFYYRLGRVVVELFTTIRGFTLFWPRLFAVLRDELKAGRSRRGKHATVARERRPADFAFEVDAVRGNIVALGPAGAAQWVRDRQLPPRLAARLLIEIARTARQTDIPLAVELAAEVVRLDRSEHRVKWLAMVLAEAGVVTEAAQLMRDIVAAGGQLTGIEQRAAGELNRLERLLKTPPALSPRRSSPGRPAKSRRVLLVAEQALPLRWSIAAVRLHAIALAIRMTGRDVVVAVLPIDTAARRMEAGAHVRHSVDGIWYYELPGDHAAPALEESVVTLERFAADQGVDLIETELSLIPANAGLEVGRRLGLPVVLDDLGDELFPAPQGMRACETERAVLTRQQQRRLAGEADAWVRWLPAPADAIGFAGHASLEHYGAVIAQEPESAKGASGRIPLRDDPRLAARRVVGFFGEASPRYDFDVLAALPVRLAAGHAEVSQPALLIAGLGRTLERLQTRAADEGFQDRFKFVRAPSYWDIPAILAAMDIFVAPLRDDPTMLVTPPFEIVQALAFGLPVVAPATAEALRWADAGVPLELAAGCQTNDVADTVAALLADPVRLMRASERVRSWAERHASPEGVAGRLDGLYRQFDEIGTERRARG